MGAFELKDDKLINNFDTVNSWSTPFSDRKQFYFAVLLLSFICEFTEYEITSKLLVMDEARLQSIQTGNKARELENMRTRRHLAPL